MIGKIRGNLVEVSGNLGLLETVSGVFYEVYLPASLISSLLPTPLEIYTYLHVREDAQILFGFAGKREHDLFILLLSVSGVGPKTAFSISSFFKSDELIQAIRNNDVTFISRVPGLGKKTAMKIILELAPKLHSEFSFEKMQVSEDDKTVIDALVSLGFKTQEAKDILQKLPSDLTMEQKITEGIKLATAPRKPKS